MDGDNVFNVLSALSDRLSVLELAKTETEKNAHISGMDAASTRNAVLTLLQRMEPRVALIESIFLELGVMEYDDKGQLVKAKPAPEPKPKAKTTRKTKKSK